MDADSTAAGPAGGASGREGLVDQVGNLVLGDQPAAVAGAGEPAAGAPVAGARAEFWSIVRFENWQLRTRFQRLGPQLLGLRKGAAAPDSHKIKRQWVANSRYIGRSCAPIALSANVSVLPLIDWMIEAI